MNECYPSTIREEELKNRVAADFFGAYDCTRIVGNIDFCASVKSRDARQMAFLPEETLYWAEAKNHPTDIHRMLTQLVLTIKGETAHMDFSPPRFIGCFDNEKIAFVEYHNVLPVFSYNDFNWTQTPSSVDENSGSDPKKTDNLTVLSRDWKFKGGAQEEWKFDCGIVLFLRMA